MTERLEERRKARGEILRALFHDIATPLMALKGFALGLLDPELDGAGRAELAQAVVSNAERIQSLLEDMEFYFEESETDASYAPEPLDLGRFLRDHARQWAPAASKARCRLEADAPDGLLALADPRCLDRILQNLIGNALKYNRPGGWVRLACARRGGKIRVRVEDSGVGIPAEHLPRIFEGGYRAPPAPGAPFRDGKGLGLSIVRRLLSLSGDRIRATSRLGVGSVFTFTLEAAPRRRRGRASSAPFTGS